jgi:hypothetical protein
MCFLQLASKTSSSCPVWTLPPRCRHSTGASGWYRQCNMWFLDIDSPLEWFHVGSLWLIISIIIIYRRFPTYQRITFKLPQQFCKVHSIRTPKISGTWVVFREFCTRTSCRLRRWHSLIRCSVAVTRHQRHLWNEMYNSCVRRCQLRIVAPSRGSYINLSDKIQYC